MNEPEPSNPSSPSQETRNNFLAAIEKLQTSHHQELRQMQEGFDQRTSAMEQRMSEIELTLKKFGELGARLETALSGKP